MKVIAVTERGEDYATAVVQISEGKTGEETFLSWIRKGCKGGHSGYEVEDMSDEEIFEMNTEYAFVELTVL